ncbi:hypothetical protein DCAR_0935186 [Daucus carota subsp. sativus]|uniref:Leucine-rich repeat-containing N-terminal plant-type domain-containing protein n=1 Tax=Daucus carota subsp. sativus TaxID=79200 RepID=A0AAF0XWM8_DAUCS|nr:hypothetical protein DCAR_0935186 [Daucus carota subsp. sativus]
MQKHMSFLVLVYALSVLSFLKFGCGSCDESEKQALLLLKESLTDEQAFNCLSSWVGDDCCAWYGIGCNNITGHVLQLDLRQCYLTGDQINPSLLDLKYLTHLDLSYNSFENVQIPEFFGSFKDLTYLNLSHIYLKGSVPHHFGNLSNLRYLDLSAYFHYDLSIDNMEWLTRLSSLVHLDLSFVDLSRATNWFRDINMLPDSLLVLKMVNCQLPNNIPLHLPFTNITSLISLNLGLNQFNSSFPLWVFNNTGIAYLSLRSNQFNGPIPDSIGKLTSLVNLDLSSNNFQGPVPESIGALAYLANLDLGENYVHGLIPQSIGNLTSLQQVNLAGNEIIDQIPSGMGNLTGLRFLNINFNELRGFLPETFCQISKLETLFARGNQLSGSIPRCIGKLSNLGYLDLSHNSWDGFLSEHHFANLTSLRDLSISSRSNLVLNVSSAWAPPFQLESIYLESLKVGPKFPNWLLAQGDLQYLLIPNTSMSDVPTDWFVSFLSRATTLDLSNNEINSEQLSLISVDSSPFMSALLLSNNRLSGEFPAFLCNLTSLSILVLSNNNFSGKIPQCISNMTRMGDLDVMNNSLSGEIPVFLGFWGELAYLNLHNNEFEGTLPWSIQNLRKLVALDAGKNNLRDILPPWTRDQLPHLRYLILRSNNFYGNIPTELCHHTLIQVLDLSQNLFTGNIPPCFNNFSAMITSDSSEYLYYHAFSVGEVRRIVDDAKGYEQIYTSTLRFMFAIDLSNNNISGEIPEELMDLSGLMSLNLAGNHLAGRIPDKIGKLGKLEYLDLSRNELYGPIPQSLSDLNFLSRLNLSFNDLSGRIPTGNQLQTLDNPSIYAGNNQLCGKPIQKPCTIHDSSETNSDSDDGHVWFYAGIGPGLLVGFLGFCASLHFIKSWRYLYFQTVEKAFDKIAIKVALLRRKIHNKQVPPFHTSTHKETQLY